MRIKNRLRKWHTSPHPTITAWYDKTSSRDAAPFVPRLMKIADLFAAQLSQLQRESEISERKTAATLARAKALVSDLQKMQDRWDREDAA